MILYHNMLLEQIDKVERGEDPMGTIRDPAQNEPWVQVRREGESSKMVQSGFAPGPGDPVFGGTVWSRQ